MKSFSSLFISLLITSSIVKAQANKIESTGPVGIGTLTPTAALEIANGPGWTSNLWRKSLKLSNGGVISFPSGQKYFGMGGASSPEAFFIFVTNVDDVSQPAVALMKIDPNGNVGIGTSVLGAYKLAVAGTIGAKKVKVTQDGWADFVFDPEYHLPSLQSVSAFIKEHKHLPEIPSAKEVAADGLDLGEMNKKLLQKVEELTLYLIEMNEKVAKLEAKMQDK
jgi:hypothetical protein